MPKLPLFQRRPLDASAQGSREVGENLCQHHPPLQRSLGQRLPLQHQTLGDSERAGRRSRNMKRRPSAVLRVVRRRGQGRHAGGGRLPTLPVLRQIGLARADSFARSLQTLRPGESARLFASNAIAANNCDQPIRLRRRPVRRDLWRRSAGYFPAGAGIGAAGAAAGLIAWGAAPPVQELHPEWQQPLEQPPPQHEPQVDPHEVQQDDVQHVLQHVFQQQHLPQRRPQADAGSAAANHSKANTVSTVPKRRMTQPSCVKK